MLDPLIALCLALSVGAAWVLYPRKQPVQTPMTDETKNDSLAGLRPDAGSMQTGLPTPPEVEKALMEIVAEAIRTNSLHRHWDLTGLQSGGFPLGSYRITIEKTA